MGKSKAQGTRFETELVNYFTNVGFAAGRLAEGGRNDRGDILIHNDIDEQWVVEAKATERLNVTRVLAKAIYKGGPRTVLIWKRLVKTGKQIRQADGEKIVVVMTLGQFTELLRERL